MKKNLSKILLIILALALLFALSACDPESGKTDDPNPGGDPETATFTVRFNSDGDVSFSEFDLTGVKYGSKIEKPKNKDGSEAKPIKKGYTFLYWTLNGGDEFDFETTEVRSNIILKAVYTANSYEHNAYLYDPAYIPDAEAIYKDHVKFSEEAGKDKVSTTYDSEIATLAIPQTDIEGDYFVYWYYYDAEGNQVMLTQWAEKGATELKLAGKYTVDRKLDVYAMWHSALPKMTVSFYESEAGGNQLGAISVPKRDTLTEKNLADNNIIPSLAGYDFGYWYYIENAGEENERKVKFVFYSEAEGADNKGATKIEENLKLYVHWVKRVEISDAAGFNAIKNALSGDDEALKNEYLNANIFILADITGLEDWKALYSVDEPFAGKLDGGGHTLTLSYADAEFMAFIAASTGDVKNLKVTASKTAPTDLNGVESEIVYIGGIVGLNKGLISGCSATLTVNSIDVPMKTEAGVGIAQKDIVIGGLAALNASGGEITDNLSAVTVSVSGSDKVYAGGLIGRASGGTVMKNSAGVTIDVSAVNFAYAGGFAAYAGTCRMTQNHLTQATVSASAINAYAGGYAASVYSGSISECYSLNKITVSADGSSAYAGGVVASNAGTVSNCRANASVTAVSSVNAAVAGGVSALNLNEGGSRGAINYSYSIGDVTATASATAIATAGGISGENYQNTISNSFSACAVSASQELSDKPARIGSAVGYIGVDTAFSKVYYSHESALTLNGIAYDYEAETPTFTATSHKDIVDALISDFKNGAWTTGTLGFSADNWATGDDFPLLKIETPETPEA